MDGVPFRYVRGLYRSTYRCRGMRRLPLHVSRRVRRESRSVRFSPPVRGPSVPGTGVPEEQEMSFSSRFICLRGMGLDFCPEQTIILYALIEKRHDTLIGKGKLI